MINEALKGIRNHISRQSRESGAFRKAARDNSGKIAIEYKNLEQFDFLSKLLTKR